MFDFRFELTRSDYAAFQKSYLLRSPHGKKLMRHLRIALLLLVLGQVYLYALGDPLSPAMWIPSVLIAVAVFFLPHITQLDTKYGHFLPMQKGKFFEQGTITFHFDENSYTYTSPNAEGTTKYTAILRVDAGPDAVYLYQAVNQALIIPDRAFADDAEKQQFVAFIQRKIAGDAAA